MPKYGVLEISEEDLAVLRKLEKNTNLQRFLLEIRDKKYPVDIQQALVKLMELQFEITTAEKTTEHINTAKGLHEALGIFIVAISKDNSPKINTHALTQNLSQHLKTLRSAEIDPSKQMTLLHIEDLLNVGLIHEAAQALKKINLLLYTNTQTSTLEAVSQQLELIIQKTPKEKQEYAALSVLRTIAGEIKEQQRLFEASKSTSIKSFLHTNMLFTLASFSTNSTLRHEALIQLWDFFRTSQAHGLYQAYKDNIKDNPQKLAYFNLMEELFKLPNSEKKDILFANYFLNPSLTERERASAAPVLLVHLNIEQIMHNMNLLLSSTPDNMKEQVIKNWMQLLSQMIYADNLNQNISNDILNRPLFEEFLNKLPENLAFQARLAIGRALDDRDKIQRETSHFIAGPKKAPMFSIESFLKDELPKLDPKDPRYKNIIANIGDSLFLTHASLFLRLRPGDFYKGLWRKKPEESHLIKLIQSTNNIADFIVSQIKEAPDLATKRKIAMFFADLGAHMIQQSNPDFHATSGIAWGLAKLPDKWLGLEDSTFSKQFENALKPIAFLSESNFTKYRKREKESKEEGKMHVPLFGVMLKDLESLDENIDRDFPFWVQAKARHYQYINVLHDQFVDYFRTKRPAMSINVSKMAVDIGVSSAPAALETDPSRASQMPSVASAPATLQVPSKSPISSAAAAAAPSGFVRATPKSVLKSYPAEIPRQSQGAASESVSSSFVKAKHPSNKRASSERVEPLLSQARTKQSSGVSKELDKARTQVQAQGDMRDRRRAAIRTSKDISKMLKEEREATPQVKAKDADTPLVSTRSSKRGSGPKK